MNVFELFATLSLDKSEYEEGLNSAEKEAEGFGSKFSSGLATAAKVGGVAMTAVGTAALAAGKALSDTTKETAEYGDNIDKMSQKIGISAEAYQEWDFIAQHSGTSMETLKTSFKTLSNAAQDGKDSFEQLGISLEDAASMSTEDLFSAVITGLQNMEEGTERTALASDLLGRGAMELGALFNTSAEETEAMRQQVHDLGGVMSNEAVKAAAQYQDSLQDMNTAMDGLKRNLTSEFLPGISTVMDGLANIFSGDYDEGLDQISDGIDDLVTKLTDNLPKMLEVGVKIIEALAKSILENLPKLMPTLVQLVLDIGNMLIENLPLLIQTAIQLVTQLFVGIANALPQILPTLIEAIVGSIPIVIDALVEALPQLIQGLITLVIGIVEALPQIIQALIDALPTIITSIVNGLIEALPQLIEGCVTLVIELVKHLPEIIMALIQAIPQIIMSIVQAFAPIVGDLGELAAQGISAIINWFKELPGKIAEWFTRTIEKVAEFGKNLKEKATNAAKEFKENLINGIKELPERIKEIGRNIVEGLKSGIKEKWDAMVEWFTDLGSNLINGFKNVFGIHSPSTVFAGIGENMAKGLGVGWKDEIGSIGDMMSDSLGVSNMKSLSEISKQSTTEASNPIVIKNTVVLEGDVKRLFNALVEENRTQTRATGTNLMMA